MRFVCDYCNDLTNIEADRMEIQGEKLMVYSRGRLVYVADLGQIMLAKLTPGREETRGEPQKMASAAAASIRSVRRMQTSTRLQSFRRSRALLPGA